MVRERIDIHMGQRKVNAEFLFQNTANAPTRVLMGFPEEGGGDIEVPGPNRSTWFKSFRSWVDGEPVAVQRRPSEGDDMFYKQWWTKEVTFAARQERTVRNEYVTTLGGSATGISWLTYVLSTGRPWQGTIGEALAGHHRRGGDYGGFGGDSAQRLDWGAHGQLRAPGRQAGVGEAQL